jgi:hypothetical protein
MKRVKIPNLIYRIRAREVEVWLRYTCLIVEYLSIYSILL